MIAAVLILSALRASSTANSGSGLNARYRAIYQTSKEVGLAKLRLTAEKGRLLQPYARMLLAVAALHDKDRGAASRILEGLAREFPHNRLYAAELSRIKSAK